MPQVQLHGRSKTSVRPHVSPARALQRFHSACNTCLPHGTCGHTCSLALPTARLVPMLFHLPGTMVPSLLRMASRTAIPKKPVPRYSRLSHPPSLCPSQLPILALVPCCACLSARVACSLCSHCERPEGRDLLRFVPHRVPCAWNSAWHLVGPH